jgi:hypothetical protein
MLRLAALLAVMSFAGAQSPPAAAIGYPALLERLTDARWLSAPAPAGERCVQFSSYDRRSDKGPANTEDWYANDDRGQYLRTEERDGKKEYVMADLDGPGCIARIWSANPSGELFFDLDGERVWTVDFAALTGGKVAPVGEPLAGVHSKGANCYLPIPFQKHLKLSASKNDFYYHVDVVQFAKGTQVPTFAPALLEQHRSAIVAAVDRLQRRLVEPLWRAGWDAGLSASVDPGVVVRSVEVVVGKRKEGVDLGAVLRKVLLVVECGGEETVRVPVLDFFGGGPDWRPHQGYLLGVREDGTGYCNLPMPMPKGGSIALVLDGEPTGADCDLQGVDPHLRLATEPLQTGPLQTGPLQTGPAAPAAAEPLLFHASFHLEKGFPSRPFRDHLVLDAKGMGRFVGCALIVKNPPRGWWGEGDEKFTVDGEAFPSWFGTGSEDYFGYAWCDTHLFSSAFHGQVQCDGPGNFGFTAVHRMHVLDSVPFTRSFRFDLEVWHWVPGLKLDYATVAYWYGAPGATAGLPAVPAAAARRLDRLPPPKVFVADGAIEGESLAVVSCSGGQHEVQDVSFVAEAFSRDHQRWWRDGKPGDALVLAVPVAAAGRYRVRAAFCRNVDYGTFQCALGGQPLGAPVDCYSKTIGSSGPLELGTVELPAGNAELRFTITGKNASATAYMVGLDYLLLEKAP